jgi:hypothetical protein
MWTTDLVAVDSNSVVHELKVWKKGDKGIFNTSTTMKHIEVDNLAVPTTTKYGSHRVVTSKTTATTPSEGNCFDIDTALKTALLKHTTLIEDDVPFLMYGRLKTAELDDVQGTKAPNFRGTVQANGIISDTYGWMPDNNVRVINKCNSTQGVPNTPIFVLSLMTRQRNRQNEDYYNFKMHSNAVFGDDTYFRNKIPAVHENFMRDYTATDTPALLKDDCYPRMTVYTALRKINTEPENTSIFLKGTFEVVEAGSNLTVPICGEQDCGLQCGYESDVGPFTCKDHGVVEPHIISRPTASIVLRTQDNRHEHTDRDVTVSCTIAKHQEEVYLGMTLDALQEELVDVDCIRDCLKGQRFHCTLIISKNTITAARLQKDYTK